MNRLCDKWQELVWGVAIALILLFQLPSPAHAQASDSPCIHGMRIVGEQSVYLSHMGLFNNSCHDYQGLFEVSLEGTNNPQKIYLDAQKKDANQNEFTIEPTQKFVLPEFAAGKLTSFKANIYSGQYERSATKPKLLASDVTVKLKRVLHFRQFKVGAKQPTTSEYLLFGTSAEQLAAHLITAPPDFDQVVALKSPLPLTDTESAKAVRLVLPNRPTPDSQANLKQALKPGDKPAVQVNGQQPNKAIETGIQYFLETADYKA
ncbi:hypothetical protein H6F90_10600 [Trichocoleus sp. FACHB-591]|uniref:hypothetical protein n=1 Tax=Trichocoleus sp. FACHB-591 TaxID=2692872 RepID=UPI001686D8E3|nr:hypothetical protein [Trichocoleus sp. FACHB-591]MBD2095605.1 hypothetical protein [Trichocoleus sp. FACHB-591]